MDLKEFIEKYQEEINNKDFEEVYKNSYHDFESYAKIGKLTELFYKCGVNPLDFMGYVPAGYAYGSNIDKVTIPDSVTSIRVYAFDHCTSLTSVTIGDGVTSIGFEAFWGCSSLTSITIPDSVTSIGGEAFANCTSLTSVTIGNGVTSIGDFAFDGCTSLKSITYRGSKNQWDTIDLYPNWKYGSSLETIHCSDGDINL